MKAAYLHDYVLQLSFEEALNVAIYELDFYPLLIEDEPGEALRPLRDLTRFQTVKGDYALLRLNPETDLYD